MTGISRQVADRQCGQQPTEHEPGQRPPRRRGTAGHLGRQVVEQVALDLGDQGQEPVGHGGDGNAQDAGQDERREVALRPDYRDRVDVGRAPRRGAAGEPGAGSGAPAGPRESVIRCASPDEIRPNHKGADKSVMPRTRGVPHGIHHRNGRCAQNIAPGTGAPGTERAKYLRRMRGGTRPAPRGTRGQSGPDVVTIMPTRTDRIRMQHGCGVLLVDDQETVEEFVADRRDRGPRPRPCPAGPQGVR